MKSRVNPRKVFCFTQHQNLERQQHRRTTYCTAVSRKIKRSAFPSTLARYDRSDPRENNPFTLSATGIKTRLYQLVGHVLAVGMQQRFAHDVGQIRVVRVDDVIEGVGRVKLSLQCLPRRLQHLEHHVVAATAQKRSDIPRQLERATQVQIMSEMSEPALKRGDRWLRVKFPTAVAHKSCHG